MKCFEKLSLLIVLSLFICPISQAQKDGEKTILKIGDDAVSKNEFKTIYFKNNKDSALNKEALDEYMDLFIDFKLKVKEAEKMGLDTTRKFKKEFQQYKKQLAQPYLIDSSTKEELLKEAYRRTKEQVHASHILVRVPDNGKPEDALKRAKSIKARVMNSDSSFLEIGQKVGRKNQQVQASDLGYFDAFSMVYPFENAAYETEVGAISDPVRTEYGYHLVKVHDKRPSEGRLKVAHIMKHAPKKASPQKKQKAKKEIQSIYKKVQNGGDFKKMARKHSDDRRSRNKGGELSWFGYGDMLPSFSEAAFSLDSNGAVSEPVRTRYGYHIIKRLDHKPLKGFEEMRPRLQKQLKNSDRYQKVKEATVNDLKEEYGLKVKKRNLKRFSKSLSDGSFKPKEWEEANEKLSSKKLFSFADTSYPVSSLAYYIGRKTSLPEGKKEWVDQELDSLVRQTLLDYEKSRLKEKYPRYRALLNEYRDGILLFELMEKKVWNKALEDTVGLKTFYEEHKEDYKGKKRLDLTYLNCDTREKAEKAKKWIEEGGSKRSIQKRLREKEWKGCKVDSGSYEKGEYDFLSRLDWEEGVIDVMKIKEGESMMVDASTKGEKEKDRFMVGKVHQVLPPAPKKLEEVRGLVSSDYQDHLEEKWVEQLRKEYEIEVDRDLLHSIAEEGRKSE